MLNEWVTMMSRKVEAP